MFKLLRKITTPAWALKQLFVASPMEASALSLFVVLQGLIPAASLYAIQGIIQWIASSTSFPLFFVSLWGGMLFLDTILTPVVAVVRLHLNEKILAHCNLLLMKKANTIQSLEPFENSTFYDEMQFLKNESSRKPMNFVYVLTGFAKEGIALVSVLAVLSSIAWWIPLGMLVANLPHAISKLWFEKQSWDQMLFRSPESRKMAWLSSTSVDERFAKEIRLFGFGAFLIEKYTQLVKEMHQALSKKRWKQSILSVLLSSITVLGNIALISAILLQAKHGVLQISALVVAIQALVLNQSQMTGCISYMGMSVPIIAFFGKLQKFLKSTICPISEEKAGAVVQDFHEIQFQNVSFSYADGRRALSEVTFTIRRGEKIAIVGRNGAGKSTIVKLLLRFYDPSEGRILVDGKDLRSIDIQSWRSLISGVFQDFGQYHLTVGENISIGKMDASQKEVNRAASHGGFQSVLKRLPKEFDTLLGKEFGGTALSGGEWQKMVV